MSPGRFITFEGGEGGGKSTQARRLAERLQAALAVPVVLTREPGGAPEAEAIRALLLDRKAHWEAMSEALLHFAARREHLVQKVWPALKRGEWVISDRFADSTRAYQGAGQGMDRAAIETLYGLAVGDFRPDLTLILDLDAEEGLNRTRRRAKDRGEDPDRYERMDPAFHRRLRQAFRDIAAAEPGRCHLIDASGDEAAVAELVWRAVARHFGL